MKTPKRLVAKHSLFINQPTEFPLRRFKEFPRWPRARRAFAICCTQFAHMCLCNLTNVFCIHSLHATCRCVWVNTCVWGKHYVCRLHTFRRTCSRTTSSFFHSPPMCCTHFQGSRLQRTRAFLTSSPGLFFHNATCF